MEGSLQFGQKRVRQTFEKGVVTADVAKKKSEFIAPQPRQDICRANDVPHALGRISDELVTGGVTEAVVDRLKTIEIDEGDRRTVPGNLRLGKVLFDSGQRDGQSDK